MFTAESILRRLKEQPFVPVRIVTSSGQSYDVPHPDLVWIAPRWLLIGKPSNQNPDLIEGASRVAIMHISDMQDLPRTAPDTNGPPVS